MKKEESGNMHMVPSDPDYERREILRRYRNLLSAWELKNHVKRDTGTIRKAFKFALDAHKDMRRRTGEPYIYHPLEVARIVVAEIGLGQTSIICALLHDVVEDTDYSLTDIEMLFGTKVMRIIDGLTKIKGMFDYSTSSIQAENFRKMLLTLSDDVRVILIKLADRMHNMRTLDAMPREKQLKIASETLFLYAPLAHRLGLYAFKSKLEDLGLKYTEPEVYNSIAAKIEATSSERATSINKFIYPIKKKLAEQGFVAGIEGRLKSIYSIWMKMKEKGIPFEEVYDLFAIRIIIDTSFESEKVDCWKVYSLVTDFYNPKQNRLRDWISTPKVNGYESLHTTVMSHAGQWVEVQIRTKRMDEIAEKGYAAHWKYKGESGSESGLDRWLARITELLQTPESNALDFLDDFKLNLFSEEIFVFTPKGELRTLPVGSTALDFAYAIHSEIGHTSIGAKVNHKLVPLRYELNSGDQVEIITSRKQRPKDEWINYVVTARAKSKIKEAVKEMKRNYYQEGRKRLEDYFTQLGVDFTNANVGRLQHYFKLPSLIELYFRIANGQISIKELKNCCEQEKSGGLFNLFRINPFSKSKNEEPESLSETITNKFRQQPESVVLEGETSSLLPTISNCCNPIPGDDVVGFMTEDKHIEIHRTNCPVAIQLMSKYGNRIVKTKWNNKETIKFLTGIKITGIDRKGLVNEISRVITEEMDTNMRSFHLESSDGISQGIVMLYVNDSENLNDIIFKLKGLESIKKVVRINRIEDDPVKEKTY